MGFHNAFHFQYFNTTENKFNLFRTPTLLVLLNNSDSALLLSPPLYQKKWREGSDAHCLRSVSLFMNRECWIMVACAHYSWWSKISATKAKCSPSASSQTTVFALTLEVQTSSSSLFLQQNCIHFLSVKPENRAPFQFWAHVSNTTIQHQCSNTQGKMFVPSANNCTSKQEYQQTANHSDTITLILWKCVFSNGY